MELQLSNKLQHHIADLMWNAKDSKEINKIISIYGRDAVVVYNMILATHFDNVESTDLAENILRKFRLSDEI